MDNKNWRLVRTIIRPQSLPEIDKSERLTFGNAAKRFQDAAASYRNGGYSFSVNELYRFDANRGGATVIVQLLPFDAFDPMDK